MATTVDRIYREHVKTLPSTQRLELLSLIAQDLAAEGNSDTNKPKTHLRDLRGLGKGLWEGIDAQEYVNRLRDEWDDRTP